MNRMSNVIEINRAKAMLLDSILDIETAIHHGELKPDVIHLEECESSDAGTERITFVLVVSGERSEVKFDINDIDDESE